MWSAACPAVTGRPTRSAAGEATIQIGRRTERVRMVEIPVEEARPLLRVFPVEVPNGVGFMKNAGLVTGPNPDEFEALAGTLPGIPVGSRKRMSDNPFDPAVWRPVDGFDLTDITYHRHVVDGKPQPTVRVAFDRPEVRNAFRPHSVDELFRVMDHARMSPDVGVVLLTGNGPSPKDGVWAFCSGGDQRIRGRTGYQYASGETAETVDPARAGRLHILEVQRLIRFMPKVVICLVNGWAAGGGHSLHAVCDLTLASREHARFKQTDADVGSFDGGYGSAYLAQSGRAEVRARDLFPRPRVHRRGDARDGRGQRGRRPRRSGIRCAGVGGGYQREVAAGRADAEILVQPD